MSGQFRSKIKRFVFPDGVRSYRVPFGLYRGINLRMDLQSRAQLFFGFAERETHAAIRKAAKNAEWMIDIGCGQGELSLYFANEGVEKVLAFDPSSYDIAEFEKNLSINEKLPRNRFQIENKFVGCEEGENFVSLDSLKDKLNGPGFLKIDVDGAEVDVLNSAKELLSQKQMSVLIETHSPELEEGSIDILQKHGFDCQVVKPAWYRKIIPELRPIEHNQWLVAEKD